MLATRSSKEPRVTQAPSSLSEERVGYTAGFPSFTASAPPQESARRPVVALYEMTKSLRRQSADGASGTSRVTAAATRAPFTLTGHQTLSVLCLQHGA